MTSNIHVVPCQSNRFGTRKVACVNKRLDCSLDSGLMLYFIPALLLLAPFSFAGGKDPHKCERGLSYQWHIYSEIWMADFCYLKILYSFYHQGIFLTAFDFSSVKTKNCSHRQKKKFTYNVCFMVILYCFLFLNQYYTSINLYIFLRQNI